MGDDRFVKNLFHNLILIQTVIITFQYLIIKSSAVFTMRPMTVKQAQKWLQKFKTTSQNSFKELSKILKKYQKSSDDHDCFVKLNTLLLEYPELTMEINGYLEEGNKFVVNQSEVQKVNELVKYIRKVDMNSFQEIANYITRLHMDRKNQPASEFNEDQQNRLVRNQVLFQVKGKPQLESYAQKALFSTPEEIIRDLPLGHLKSNKVPEQTSKQISEHLEVPLQPPAPSEPVVDQDKTKAKMYPPFINQNQEKYFFRQFEANVDPSAFQQIIKIIHIYQLGIISRVEAVDLVKPFCQEDFSAVKDLIQSREGDRRRNSSFRPLNDMDFTNVQRATHSYVKMPEVYPHYCSNTTPFLKEILNKKWVSVPRGSQETFNVRIKNSYQENLIKAEDDRSEFDVYCKRLQKTIEIVDKIISKLRERIDADISSDIQTVISLGIIQTLYRNTSKEQRQQLEFHLRNMRYDTLEVFQSRLKSQYAQLMDMRSIHGLRTWNEVANKNYHKALDFKGHEFKRTQKLRMKAGVFLEQLKFRSNYLKSKGENKSYDTPFEDKKQFFSILNSFETSSRKERCLSRNLPTPRIYNMKEHSLPILLPAMILAFQDEEAMSAVYSFVVFYIDFAVANEAQRIRCRTTFKQIMGQFFGMKNFLTHSLNTSFNEEKFFGDMLNHSIFEQNVEDWIQVETEAEYQHIKHHQGNDEIPYFNSIQESPSEYSFQPLKADNNLVFYASQNFYVFLRFLYALYERIIRMKEVAQSERKVKLFEILYFACIKTKESAKFEDSLNTLFGEHAYLFTTLYKLLQSLQKSLNLVSLCQLYNFSLRHMEFQSQQIYLLILNRYMLESGMTTSRLIRFTYEPQNYILYINSLDSYYRMDEQTKELIRRRADITSKIQIYTLLKSQSEGPKTRKGIIQRNQMQYCFEGNSIKMINLCSKEDYIVGHRISFNKNEIMKELEKTKKLREKIG